MNRLSSTIMYGLMKDTPIFKDLNAVMNPKVIEKYKVNKIWYDHYLKIFKGYKYPLAKAVVELAEADKIILINAGDPEDQKTQIYNIQPFVPATVFKTSEGTTCCVNISHRAKYIRNKISGEIESLKISERELYTFLQTAAACYIVNIKDEELTNNTKFAKICAEIYTTILSRCINKTYPISAEREDMIVLNFYCAIYCLQVMFGYSEEKSIAYAYTLKNVDKNVVDTNCKLINDSLIMYDMNDFIRIVENEFDYIRKGAITYRNLLLMFNKMYGQNSFFAMEHFFSFFTMIEQSSMRIGMYADGQLDNIVKPYLKDIETLIMSAYNTSV
jgi:hypothetical protein